MAPPEREESPPVDRKSNGRPSASRAASEQRGPNDGVSSSLPLVTALSVWLSLLQRFLLWPRKLKFKGLERDEGSVEVSRVYTSAGPFGKCALLRFLRGRVHEQRHPDLLPVILSNLYLELTVCPSLILQRCLHTFLKHHFCPRHHLKEFFKCKLPENNSQVPLKETDRKALFQCVRLSGHETLGWLREQRTEQPSLWS